MDDIGDLERPSIEEQTGLVVLLDATGTRGILASRSASLVVEQWDRFLFGLTTWSDDVNRHVGAGTSTLLSFSDTVYLTIANGAEGVELSASLVANLRDIFFDSLVDGIFLRGVIAAGVYYQSGTKVFGPAIDEAAAWYEEADWFGISATPSFGRILDRLELDGVNLTPRYEKANVPYKDPRYRDSRSSAQHWVLNWPQRAVERNPNAKRDMLLSFADHGGTVSPGVHLKYENTISFYGSMVK